MYGEGDRKLIKRALDFIWWKEYPNFAKQMYEVVTETNKLITFDEFKRLVHSDQNLYDFVESHLHIVMPPIPSFLENYNPTQIPSSLSNRERIIIKNLLEET